MPTETQARRQRARVAARCIMWWRGVPCAPPRTRSRTDAQRRARRSGSAESVWIGSCRTIHATARSSSRSMRRCMHTMPPPRAGQDARGAHNAWPRRNPHKMPFSGADVSASQDLARVWHSSASTATARRKGRSAATRALSSVHRAPTSFQRVAGCNGVGRLVHEWCMAYR
jgi:hypothetical protein